MSAVTSPDVLIYRMGNELPVGGQLSGQECPFCARLGSYERSLSVSREANGILYRCHRNKCGLKGWVRADGKQGSASTDRAKGSSKYATYIRSAVSLSEQQKDWLWDEWGMEDRHIRKGGIEYSPACNRLILPIYSCTKESAFGRIEVGSNLRSMDKGVKPKSLICMTTTNDLCMSYYPGSINRDVVIVVEDQASAIRASEYCSAVALLGVYMDAVRARAVARLEASRVLFCLDNDAFSTCLSMSQKYGPMMKSSMALCPDRDLKNMSDKQLRKFLTEEAKLPLEEAASV